MDLTRISETALIQSRTFQKNRQNNLLKQSRVNHCEKRIIYKIINAYDADKMIFIG